MPHSRSSIPIKSGRSLSCLFHRWHSHSINSSDIAVKLSELKKYEKNKPEPSKTTALILLGVKLVKLLLLENQA